MADMIVDGAKLDACLDAEADAIRAKTGGSADIPFDYANSKGFADAIAAIPSGGSEILTSNNLLEGCTFVPGYLSGDGSITSPGDSTKELTSSEIDISGLSDSILRFVICYNSGVQTWIALGYYDENHNWISRSSGSGGNIDYFSPPSNTAYVRVSFRTYGDCAIYVAKNSDFYSHVKDAIEEAGATVITA